jgi:alkylation response protein AidB-like acyl-CoA dehydrogenase
MSTVARSIDSEELALFEESVTATLTRAWASPALAGDDDAADRLAELWQLAAEQHWLEPGRDGLLNATVAAMRVLGRAACPLPLADAFAAAQLMGGAGEIDGIFDATVRPLVGTADNRFMDGALAATHVLVVGADRASVTLHEIAAAAPTSGLAMPPWCNVTVGVPASDPVPVTPAQVEDALAAIRLALITRAAGAAEHAHELALRHASDRKQFGRAIGSYQAVAHRAVDGATELAALRALIDDALSQHGDAGEGWHMAVDLAVAFGRRAVKRIQFGAHHTLAAVGYFDEHPAPWLFRRVHGDVERLRLFESSHGDVGDRLADGDGTLPRLALGDAAEAERRRVHDLVVAHRPDMPAVRALERDEELIGKLADGGFATLGWPTEHGGRAASVNVQAAVSEELAYLRAPVAGLLGSAAMLAPAIMRHGTQDQRDFFLPKIARGALTFYLGYSEPEVGSDLASLRTRAVRGEDGSWVVNGQKSWGTGADNADYMWLATRTDPDALPRHKGITVFLAPTGLPGWSIQNHRALSGEISCTTFLDDVVIPDSYRVGEVHGGWPVILDALGAERVIMAGAVAGLLRQLDELLTFARSDVERHLGPRGSARRALLTDIAARLQAVRALTTAALRATAAGAGGSTEASMAKILSGLLSEDFGEAILELLGPVAALGADAPDVPGGGAFESDLRWSIMQVVGGGTIDIQRNLVARALGLPKG